MSWPMNGSCGDGPRPVPARARIHHHRGQGGGYRRGSRGYPEAQPHRPCPHPAPGLLAAADAHPDRDAHAQPYADGNAYAVSQPDTDPRAADAQPFTHADTHAGAKRHTHPGADAFTLDLPQAATWQGVRRRKARPVPRSWLSVMDPVAACASAMSTCTSTARLPMGQDLSRSTGATWPPRTSVGTAAPTSARSMLCRVTSSTGWS